MLKSRVNRHLWLNVLLKNVLMLYFCNIITYIAIDGECYNATNEKIKGIIMKWWKENDVDKPLECKHQQKSIPKHTIYNIISVPAIKTFPCTRSVQLPHYHYIGTINAGYLEGRGKLVFISDEDWSNMRVSDKMRQESIALKSSNVCFQNAFYDSLRIKEVIGTFKNGSLYGMAKIKCTNTAISIGNYKHGKPHGYIRRFNAKKKLLDVGGFEMGQEVGFHWKLRSGHLLYQDRDMINDNISPTLLFTIPNDGMLQNPIGGDYFPHSEALENIHKTKLINVLSNKSDCLMQISYELLGRENYTYSLSSRSKYPLFGTKGHTLLCNVRHRYKTNTVAKKLETLFQSIKNMIKLERSDDGFTTSSAFEVLWQLKPELAQLNIDNSTRLISDINLNINANTMKAKIFDSRPVKIFFSSADIKIDKYLKLNGLNDIMIAPEDQRFVPGDKTLGWSPTRIIGKFNHGELNGFVLLRTNVSTVGWVTVKKGILHGPSIMGGISYIIDPVSVMI